MKSTVDRASQTSFPSVCVKCTCRNPENMCICRCHNYTNDFDSDFRVTKDLRYEENRLQTFDQVWPHSFLDPRILAKTGLHFSGETDTVMCYFCGIHLSEWSPNENEISRHRQQSPCCRLLNRQSNENVPMDPASDFDLILSPLKMWTKDLCYEEQRLKTFENGWPHSFLNPQILAKTGLFFTGETDNVVCFFCGIHLSEWSHNETEISRHEEHSICRLLFRKPNENIPIEPGLDLTELLCFKDQLIIGPVLDLKQILRFEEHRLKTFENGWPHSFLNPQILAKTGLFFTQPCFPENDRVECYFCGINLSEWLPNDTEISRHRRESPYCFLLNRQPTTNIPMEPALDFDKFFPPFKISTNDLSYEVHRLETFDQDWPHSFLDPRILAKTGLYFSGVSDTVVCYFCEIQLSEWKPVERGILRHRRHSLRCRLLNRWPNTNIPMEPASDLDKLCPPLKVSTNDLRYEVHRLKTFELNWPHSFLNPRELASGGLYFSGVSDTVVCYFCGIHLGAWTSAEHSHERHYQHSSCRLINRKTTENVLMKHSGESLFTMITNTINRLEFDKYLYPDSFTTSLKKISSKKSTCDSTEPNENSFRPERYHGSLNKT